MAVLNSLTMAIQVLEILPGLVTGTEEVMQLITSTTSTLKVMQAQGRDPLPAEWSAIDTQIANMLGQLDADVRENLASTSGSPIITQGPLQSTDSGHSNDPGGAITTQTSEQLAKGNGPGNAGLSPNATHSDAEILASGQATFPIDKGPVVTGGSMRQPTTSEPQTVDGVQPPANPSTGPSPQNAGMMGSNTLPGIATNLSNSGMPVDNRLTTEAGTGPVVPNPEMPTGNVSQSPGGVNTKEDALGAPPKDAAGNDAPKVAAVPPIEAMPDAPKVAIDNKDPNIAPPTVAGVA